MTPAPFTRRRFCALLLAILGGRVEAQTSAGRALDFQIGEGFGGASPADIRAVLLSAGEAIWRHCPETRWEVPGFFIYRADEVPITIFDHRADGRIAIGLTTKGTFWAQFAYQFAHEFCHALAGHSNDWRKPWIKARKANHWVEESLCEAASLFALRAMGRSWESAPPYPNWKSFGKALTGYAEERMEKTRASLPEGFAFSSWLREHEAAMREKSTLREMNNVVALQVLPLFEAAPAGWESLASFNLGDHRDPQKTLARHFADWHTAAPAGQREFIGRLAEVFGVVVKAD